MTAGAAGSSRRINPVARQEEQVTPLELFFDLVFVLAITQCTSYMASDHTWRAVGEGALLLALLWWSWVGYAWLTSVLDPEEGAVRIVMFAAMGGLLVAALAVPRAFDDSAVAFAVSYAVVRAAHIALFVLASRDDEALRASVIGLGAGTAIGASLLIVGAVWGGTALVVLWLLALVLDMGEPFLFGSEGWRLEPAHFAERHGLIVIVALGESIVAIGVGAEGDVTAGVIVAAGLGTVLAAAMWWTYFDVISRLHARRLRNTEAGRAQNELARDVYSYLHFPLIAGIVLVALGMKTTLAHVDEPLDDVAAAALVGGTALYLLGHVLQRWRAVGRIGPPRLVVAIALLACLPVVLATEPDSIVVVAVCAAALWALIGYEVVHFAELRDRVRHDMTHVGEDHHPTG